MTFNTNILIYFIVSCLINTIYGQCEPGQFPFLKRCLDCKRGTYSPDGSHCYECPPGSYALTTGSISCEYCSPGTYASSYGSIICIPCAAGTVAPDYGSTGCLYCPKGSTSEVGSAKCAEYYESNYNYDWNYNYNYDYF